MGKTFHTCYYCSVTLVLNFTGADSGRAMVISLAPVLMPTTFVPVHTSDTDSIPILQVTNSPFNYAKDDADDLFMYYPLPEPSLLAMAAQISN